MNTTDEKTMIACYLCMFVVLILCVFELHMIFTESEILDLLK